MNCPSCKVSLSEGTRWCPGCGADLTAAPSSSQAVSQVPPTDAPLPAPGLGATPPAPAASGSPFGAASAQQTSVLAILSLVAGVLSWVALPVLSAIAAVVLGYQARKEIAHSGGAVGGDGLATAGLWLGWINLALGVLGVLVVVFCLLGPVLALLGLGAAQGR